MPIEMYAGNESTRKIKKIAYLMYQLEPIFYHYYLNDKAPIHLNLVKKLLLEKMK